MNPTQEQSLCVAGCGHLSMAGRETCGEAKCVIRHGMKDVASNAFRIGSAGGDLIAFMFPPLAGQRLTRAQALNIVAWLATIARLSDDDIRIARASVEAT